MKSKQKSTQNMCLRIRE